MALWGKSSKLTVARVGLRGGGVAAALLLWSCGVWGGGGRRDSVQQNAAMWGLREGGVRAVCSGVRSVCSCWRREGGFQLVWELREGGVRAAFSARGLREGGVEGCTYWCTWFCTCHCAICACCHASDDLAFVFIYALVLLLLVQVLSDVLVEALICSPVKQVFQPVQPPLAKWKIWAAWTSTTWKLLCNHHCNAVTGIRGVWLWIQSSVLTLDFKDIVLER